MRGILLLTFSILLVLGTTGLSHADRRVALVIGNSAYEHVPALANPRNDAQDISDRLEDMGFDVVRGLDLDIAGMRKAVRTFIGKLDGADLALFFYAGHGLQVSGSNYMAPTDAELRSYIDLDFEAMPIDLVLSAMERAAKVNLVFLDACRDNPLADNLARSMGTRSGSVGRGLAKIGSGVGSLIAFATQPGNVALDGKGRNSPFTTGLLRHLGTPGQSVTDDLILVRREVIAETGGRQVPWDNSSLTGPVVLVDRPQPPQASAPRPSAPADLSIELTYWDSIRNSGNTGLFRSYLARWPDGNFAELARARIAEIEAAEAKPPQPPAGQVAAAQPPQAEGGDTARAAPEAAVEAARTPDPASSQEAGRTEIARLDAAPEAPKPVEPEMPAGPDPVELARSMQTELNRLGCTVGRVDGKWGSASERGLKDFARRRGFDLASLEPDPDVLEQLKAVTERVCPLVCGQGLEERNGRCERRERSARTEPAPAERNAPRTESRSAGTTTATRPGRDCYVCVGISGMRDIAAGEKRVMCVAAGRQLGMTPGLRCTKQ